MAINFIQKFLRGFFCDVFVPLAGVIAVTRFELLHEPNRADHAEFGHDAPVIDRTFEFLRACGTRIGFESL